MTDPREWEEREADQLRRERQIEQTDRFAVPSDEEVRIEVKRRKRPAKKPDTLIEKLRELASSLRYRDKLDNGPMGAQDDRDARTVNEAVSLIIRLSQNEEGTEQ